MNTRHHDDRSKDEIRDHEHAITFGWEGNGGLGDTLIEWIPVRRKTATCAPVQCCSEEEIEETVGSIAGIVTVVEKRGTPRGNFRILDVFETPLGPPDLRVISGEG